MKSISCPYIDFSITGWTYTKEPESLTGHNKISNHLETLKKATPSSFVCLLPNNLTNLIKMLPILDIANHNKDHSVMIFTSLDVIRGIFISTISTPKLSI